MAKSKTQKAVLNTTTAAISEVVTLICGLLLPQLILSHFGSAYNGITISAKQFLSAISILNVGVAGAIRVGLYKTIAREDNGATSSIIRAAENHMHKVGMVLAVYILLLAIVYPLAVNTGYGFFDVSLLIIAAGIETFGQYFFGITYGAFLTADQSVYIINIFTIIATVLNTVVSVILIHIGCSIQIVKIVGAFVFFMQPLMQKVYVTRRYRIDKRAEADKSALAMRYDVMAHSIANIVHDNTDMIVLTVFTDVKIVSVYGIYNLVMGALKKTQNIFTAGTEAVFGNLWVKGEIEKIRLYLGYYEWFVTAFASSVFSTTMVMILPFIALYTADIHDANYMLPTYAIVITIAQAWFCIRAPYQTLVQGAGQYKKTKTGAFIEAGINLMISVVLVQFIGILGVAVGTLVANIFRSLQYAFFIDNHIVKRGKAEFLIKYLWSVMNVLMIVTTSNWVVSIVAVENWFEWIVVAAGVAGFSLLLTVGSSYIFYRREMNGFLKILRRALGGRKRPAR